MTDVFTPAQRSRVMRAVRGSQTGPEMVVQELVRALGYRPRCHDETLPGRPDLVFRRRRKAIFVHGCFWHRHRCEAGRSLPASNREYWQAKFRRNVRRDRRALADLRAAGWQVLVVWECQTKARRRARLAARLAAFLKDAAAGS